MTKQMRYHLVRNSDNRKVGGLPILQAPRGTCPPKCPFKGFCYAEQWPLKYIWDRVEQRGLPLAEVALRLIEHPTKRWRYGDVGDLPGRGNRISELGMRALIYGNRGRWGWCYTHKPVLGRGKIAERNKELIERANKAGFTVNLSAEGWKHADKLHALQVGPVFAVLPHTMVEPQWKRSVTPGGVPILRCPAERSKRINCSTCGGSWGPLCARPERDYIIGATSHGVWKNRIASVIAEMEMFE